MGVAEGHPVLLRSQDMDGPAGPAGGGRWPERRGWQRPPYGPPQGRMHVRRYHAHAHGGGWILPLILLTLFAGVGAHVIMGLVILLLVMGALALGAVMTGLVLARVVQAVFAPAATRSLPQRRRQPEPAPVPAPLGAPYRLSGGTLAAADGLDLYRRRLLDVLKERYVRGQISLAEFEASATLIARDPSARHLS
jgi:hypothetical protein